MDGFMNGWTHALAGVAGFGRGSGFGSAVNLAFGLWGAGERRGGAWGGRFDCADALARTGHPVHTASAVY